MTPPKRPRGTALRLLLTGAIALSLAAFPDSGQAAPASPARSVEAGSTVTLLTGDRVTLGGPDRNGEPSVLIEPRTPGAGTFSVRRDAAG